MLVMETLGQNKFLIKLTKMQHTMNHLGLTDNNIQQ